MGDLTVGLSLQSAYARSFAQFWTLLLTNLLKGFAAALVMLAILEWLLMRHLRTIADYVRNSNWLAGVDKLRLERNRLAQPDELDAIADAVNLAQKRDRSAYDNLQGEIAERRRTQDQLTAKTNDLQILNTELVQSTKEQAEFAYAISHDLKSPANSLHLLIDEVRKGYCGPINDDAQQILDQANRIVTRMGGQIDSVLSYSSSITHEIEVEQIDLNSLLTDLLADLDGQIKSTNATIEIDHMPKIAGDRMLLHLLFSNLLTNALKFRAAARQPEIQIRATPANQENQVRIAVSDNGIGIAKEHQNRIFGLFKRLHRAADYAGYGVGLALCQRIAMKHKSAIELDSTVGEGSTFSFCLKTWPR